MNIQVPVDEILLYQAMRLTHFENNQQLIENALYLLIQRYQTESLVDFFQHSPLCGIELDLTRDRDTGREIEL